MQTCCSIIFWSDTLISVNALILRKYMIGPTIFHMMKKLAVEASKVATYF